MENNRSAENGHDYLPILPQAVDGVTQCTQILTDRQDNSWKFLFSEIEDIPTAFEDNQDYDFNRIDAEKWQDVIVPSELCTQGFNIENNAEYYYRRTVNIPQDYCKNRVFLRFEGVYSNARVWINNKFCASHIGGFTPWDVEITDFAGCGKISLTVGVADMEGDRKSPWNPDGGYQSNSAWASFYAHHNIGGILRDITLFCLPKQSILQTHINTKIYENHASAEIEMAFSKECVGLCLKAAAADADGEKAKTELRISGETVRFSLDVPSAKLWDAEHPNLYVLKTALCDENQTVLQENVTKFGFREITYGGQNGTDKNKIYVNGREIKLRGVCRHDVSRLYGRSLTKADIYREIKTYKEYNVNHIRTSHYPASDYMLEVCDELGMYVEQENAACFKGANGVDIHNPPIDFLRSFAEMIEFSRNHPSVIIWSIANESGFEKSRGFRDCYDYVKRIDRTRPVIFSYPWTVKSKPLPYDIFSKHYEKVTAKLGRSDMPILHDEFAHVPCYNLDDLATDNSCRVFWGESIKRGWDNIFDTDGALGCDIWGAIDDVFYLPEKSMEKHQNHLKGECVGYGEWGCIFDTFKRLKPEAYLTKKAYTPIRIKDASVCGDKIILNVQNRFDHTDLSEVDVDVRDENGNILFCGRIKESIAPHCIGTVTLPPAVCADNMTVSFIFDGIETESIVVSKAADEPKFVGSPLKCDFAKNSITIKHNGTSVAAVSGMYLKDWKNSAVKMSRSSLKKIGANKYAASFGFGKSFLLVISENGGELQFEIKHRGILSAFCRISELVVELKPTSEVECVSWRRNALYDCYPEGHIARADGTAFKSGVKRSCFETDLSNISWEQDMSAFVHHGKTSGYNAMASNDFKTKRLNIRSYRATAENGDSLLVRTDCGHINAYADPFEENLQISKGSYMPSISWGNYWGKRFCLNRKNQFVFSLGFSAKDKEK